VGGIWLSTAIAVPALVLIAIGSLGPWVTTVLGSAIGTRGDGKLTLGLAVVALLAIAIGRARGTGVIVAGLAAAGALGVAAYDLVHIQHEAYLFDAQIASAGWGVYVSLIGAAVAVVGLVMLAPHRTALAVTALVLAGTAGAIVAGALQRGGAARARASTVSPVLTIPTAPTPTASSSRPVPAPQAPASRASSPIPTNAPAAVTSPIRTDIGAAASSPVSGPAHAAADSQEASLFAVSAQYSCLANANVVPFLQASHANVLRLILSPQRAAAAQGAGCVKLAHAAGYKVYISLQFANRWTPKQVAAYFTHVLPTYAPFVWAVGVGNEQDLTSPTANAQGVQNLTRQQRTAGQNYRADWNAVEPILVRLVPHAIRVYGEFSPWNFNANKDGFAHSRPPGVQAIAAHCYHTKRPGGLLQVPQNAAWAASKRLPLWCSEMGPALPTRTTPGWVLPDSWASWNATLTKVKSKSPDLQMISYYYWPTF
jgi:hypothetical protein